MSLSFDKACAFVLPIGPHKGRTIADVGVKASGLEYLVWLGNYPDIANDLNLAVQVYIAHPVIRAEINEIIGTKRGPK